MRYWWVSQNKTYRQERQGGYLWAPKRDTSGKTHFFWANMMKVSPGDIVYSYVSQSIVAIGTATSRAYDFIRPETFEREWERDGWRVDIDYKDVRPPRLVANFVDELMPLLPAQFGPLDRNRNGKVGYLFELPKRAAELVERAISGRTGTLARERRLAEVAFEIGDRVSNQRFGLGNVSDVTGNRVSVSFDTCGLKVVAPGYLTRIESGMSG